MSNGNDAEVIRQVCARIDRAIADSSRLEKIIVTVLVLLFLFGLAMMGYGAVIQKWEVILPGGLAEIAIVLPVRELLKLRRGMIALRVLPELLRLASDQRSKQAAFKLLERLIEQVV